jgi:RHS repeat-associated protein
LRSLWWEKINYPGTGNNSQFSYDGLGHCVQIVETSGGSTTSTKQFVWCDSNMCEARNASGTITAQYFALGETISGTSYYYTTDHLGLRVPKANAFSQLIFMTGHPNGYNPLDHSGSIREMTDSSGNIQAQYVYDPYGRATKLQGSLASDFQYAGYYFHAPSNLNLTTYRSYSSSFGRWINRDSIGEDGGLNLYAYVGNKPISQTDPSGQQCDCDTSAGAGGNSAGAGEVKDLCKFKCGKEAICFYKNCHKGPKDCAFLALVIFSTCYAKCRAGGGSNTSNPIVPTYPFVPGFPGLPVET